MSEILLPLGRMVSGDIYEGFPVLDDKTKQPLLDKDGKPKRQYAVGVAIPKQGEQHWSQTEWGRQIFNVGAIAFPREHTFPHFAWKIVDGDSTVPNKSGNVPCEQTGYKGSWVVFASRYWAPVVCNDQGDVIVLPDTVYPGCFVQMVISVAGNGSTTSPGVYVNPEIVAFIGHGEKIVSASSQVDPKKFKFGGTAPGMSPTPVSNFSPAINQVQLPPPTQGYVVTTTAPVPNPAFLQPPPSTIPPPAPVGPVMTAKAAGFTHQQLIAAGWTDETLKAHGYML